MTLAGIIIVSAFVAYLWTGYEMVLYHSSCDPLDQPGYVRNGYVVRAACSLTWPVVAKLNQELAWLFATFTGTFVFLVAVFYFLVPLNVPVWLIVAGIPALRILPIIGAALNFPIVVVSAVVFFVLFRPLGAKMPSGMQRLRR
jgi:hypothetical protein